MTAMTQEPEPIDPASGDRDSNVRLLHEAAKSQPVYRCSFFVDIVGSSTRKNTEPEASWITQSDMLYTIVEDAIEEFLPNGWYKNTGDGFVVVSSDDPEQVMNSAVSIQESLADARSGHQSAGIARMDISVSIGITSGHVYEYRGRNGRVDYLGLMLDKAARLTAVASANAIFVDRATVQDAAMRKIHSRVGEVLRYTGDEYVGDVQLVPLRGFPEPIAYHELRWGRELFGTRSQVVTDAVGQMQSGAPESGAQANTTVSPTPKAGFERMLGTLKMWNSERNFGFVTDATGEDFFVAPKLFVYPDDVPNLKPGAQLAFVPVAATAAGKARRAGAVLVVDEEAEGVVVSVPEGRNYAWVRVDDSCGNRQMVWMSTSQLPSVTKGAGLSFVVRARDGKVNAEEVELAD